MRRAVTALAAVIGLVLSGVAAHLVFRPAPRPPLAAPQTYSAPLTPEPYPDEPADFIVRRSQTWSGWELSAAASPDRLGPVPEHDPADQSLIGSTSCGEAHTALRRASARDTYASAITMIVNPKSFRELVLVDMRVRFIKSTPRMDRPRYLYRCVNPNDTDAPNLDSFVNGDAGGVISMRERKPADYPRTLSGDRAGWWGDDITVEAIELTHEWQVEFVYLDQGTTRTAVRTVDEDGVPLITEPVPPLRPKDVFDEVFEWCHAPARTFRPAGSCQSV